jgi:dTDP-4-dehydrorhamnose reductase
MRVAIVGANGQLGSDAVRAFANERDTVFALRHEDIEITDINSVAATLKELKPDLIVNTAAMHHVERCEQDPKAAFSINALGPRNLAMVAQDLGAILMHISTDYVFDGAKRRPYEERDAPQPVNTYGITKLAGEYFVRCTVDRHFVVRTSGLYGKHPCRGKGGLNFVDLMLKLGKERGVVRVIDSEEVTPTSTYDLAQHMALISRSDNFGLFHATSEGSCSWYDFAREIFAVAGLPVKVELADPQEFPSKVRRPEYSVLENAELKACRMNCFRPWQEGLRHYLDQSASLETQTQVTSRALSLG